MPTGTGAREFRVAGIYEPTPDPSRLGAVPREVRLHLPDLLDLTRSPGTPAGTEYIAGINVALTDPADATAFSRDVNARMPGVVARPSSEAAGSAGPFRVLERFHLAIAVVTIVASTVFLLALTIMLVDERRETVGILRLIGLPVRRVLVQVLIEGLIVAGAGAAFGLVLAVLSEGLINAFFQWRYDTALVFVRITRDVALTSTAIAVPLGASATVARVVGAAAAQRTEAGQAMNAVGFAWRSLVRQPARATLGVLGVAAVGALLFDMLLLSQGLVVSMRDLLERQGWDIRVSAGDLPGRGLRVARATNTAERIAALPSVGAALIIRVADARIERGTGTPIAAAFQGVSGYSRRAGAPITPPWTIMRGREATRRGRSGHRRRHRVRGQPADRRHDHAARLLRRRPRSPAARAPAGRRDRGVSIRGDERGHDGRLARGAESRVRRQRRRRSRPAARHVGQAMPTRRRPLFARRCRTFAP